MNPRYVRQTVGVVVRGGLCVWLVAGVLAGAGCASSRGRGVAVDAEIKDMAGSAAVAYARGETARAAALYERALARARLVDATDEVSRNAYNLALCRMAQGRIDEARGLLMQARVLMPVRGADTARAWVAEAEAAQRQGRLDEVAGLLQHSMDAGADAAGRAQVHLMLSSSACSASNWPAAREALGSARRDLRRIEAPELEARAEGIAAQLALTDGNVAGAAAALERQAGWLKSGGRFDEMAATLAMAGESYRTAGLTRQAYPCLMRAAAGLKALGRHQAAASAVQGALTVAQALNEPEWVAAARALTAEIGTP